MTPLKTLTPGMRETMYGKAILIPTADQQDKKIILNYRNPSAFPISSPRISKLPKPPLFNPRMAAA